MRPSEPELEVEHEIGVGDVLRRPVDRELGSEAGAVFFPEPYARGEEEVRPASGTVVGRNRVAVELAVNDRRADHGDVEPSGRVVIDPELEILPFEVVRVEYKVRAQGALYAEGPLPRPRRQVRRNGCGLVEVHLEVPSVFYYLLEPLLVVGESGREIRLEHRRHGVALRLDCERFHSDHDVAELETVPYISIPVLHVVHPAVGYVHVYAPVIAIGREFEPRRIEYELPAQLLLELYQLNVDPYPAER